jgi:hypothetical protein
MYDETQSVSTHTLFPKEAKSIQQKRKGAEIIPALPSPLWGWSALEKHQTNLVLMWPTSESAIYKKDFVLSTSLPFSFDMVLSPFFPSRAIFPLKDTPEMGVKLYTWLSPVTLSSDRFYVLLSRAKQRLLQIIAMVKSLSRLNALSCRWNRPVK